MLKHDLREFFTIPEGVFHQKRLFQCSTLEYHGEKVTAF